MSRYSNIHSQLWSKKKNKALDDDAKLLFLYLLSSPHGNMIGFYCLPIAYAAHDLGWKPDKVMNSMSKLTEQVAYDEDAEVVLIYNFLRYNPIKGDNQAKGGLKIAQQMPSTYLLNEFVKCIGDHAEDYISLFEPLLEWDGTPFEPPSEPPSESGTGEGTGDGTGAGTGTGTGNGTGTERICAPCGEIVGLYNQICVSLPKVQTITEKRKKALKTLWGNANTLDFFAMYFQKVEESDFLAGRNGKWTNCGFDWLLKPDNLTKVIEGNYDNKGETGPGDPASVIDELIRGYECG